MKRYWLFRRQLELLAAVFLLSVASVCAGDGKSAGTVSGNSVLQRFGSKEGLRQNLAIPMTNAGTSLKTIDGSGSFSPALGIPSSNQFLQVMIQPSGTGDLSTVIVGQDLDSDGTFDHSFTLGMPVSGVCANGFISCAPGTWSNCQAYAWKSDDTGSLSFDAVGVTQLGGCYCINSSCGSNLAWSNSAIVLKDLGGGSVGAIHAKDASVMITDVRTDATTITYYGQLLKSAPSAKNDVPALATAPSVLQQQAYYGNWAQLDADVSSVPLVHSGNPDSMYYKMINSRATQTGGETKKCAVLRNGVINSVPVASYSSSGTSSLCTDHFIYMMVKKLDDHIFELKLVDSGPGGLGTMHHNCNDSPGGDGWHLQHTINLPPETGSFQAKLTRALYSISNIQGAGCNAGGSASMDATVAGFNTAVQATAPCPVGGAQTPSFDWSYLFEYTTDTYQESVSNGCAVLDSDATCRIQDEMVDGVVTARNFGKTGLHQLPSCKTFNGAVQPMNVCRDWWRKERTYVCDNQRPIDFSPVMQRYNSVVTTAVDNGSTLNYTDVRRDSSGNWITAQSSITLPDREAFADCEPACKVRRPKNDTQVGVIGVMSENRTTNMSHDDLYKICTDGGTICPVEAGESVIENCRCVNQFAEAASIMQTLRLAGADSICSSGTPIPP